MNWILKLDSFWKGLIIGLLFPIIVFFFYWLIFHHQIPVKLHIKRLIQFNLLSNVIKICCVGNLLLFYVGINKKMDKFSKGIIVSALAYVVLVGFVMYYLEPVIT